MNDWKETLGAAFNIAVPSPDNIEEPSSTPAGDARAQQGNNVVHVIIDKRNRKGKVVTLVTDLLCDDDALKDLARELKQACGVGGSARGGEILIQGDFKEKVANLLRNKGFKVK